MRAGRCARPKNTRSPRRGRTAAQRYNSVHSREALRSSLAEAGMAERNREATRRGSLLGSDCFVERVGQELGRDLRVKPPSRPAKERECAMAAGAK